MSRMASKALFQSPPVNLDDLPDIVDGSYHCSNCSQGTYSYNGKLQWRYDADGNRICKKCNDKRLRASKKEIDLSKLKLNKKEDELTFDLKPATRRSKSIKEQPEEGKQHSSKLNKYQKDALKERISLPIIEDIKSAGYDGGYYSTISCNICGNMSGSGGISSNKSILLEFHVTIRSPKLQSITCHLCEFCIGKMGSLVSSLRKNADVCDKINTSIYQRNEREDYLLWKKRIGRRVSDKGGYEYFKLRETSGMMDYNVV